MKPPSLLAAAFLTIAASTAAQAAPAQTPVPETLVDQFMASFPDALELRTVDSSADPAQLAQLTGLNPGRAKDIRPILEVFQRCTSTAVNTATETAIRNMAQRLGSVKVAGLVSFYRGPDFPIFKALIDRTDKGESLSDAETATIVEVMAKYPLPDFYAQFKRLEEDLRADKAFIARVTQCALDKKQALIGAKLRYR